MQPPRKRQLAIDGISPAPMRTIAHRDSSGLRVYPRVKPDFQSRRDREKPIQPRSIDSRKLSFAAIVKKIRSFRARPLLPAIAAVIGGILGLIFVQVGLAVIACLLVLQIIQKKQNRDFFWGAFLLSLLIPLFALLNIQKTVIAKNIATYLFALLVAAVIMLLIGKHTNYHKKL